MRLKPILAIAAAGIFAATAQASIVFSNINITGSLGGGATFNTSPTEIDFYLPEAFVGDPTDPVRNGTLTLEYEASSTDAMVADLMVLSVLGAIAGSGQVFVNEVVDDLVNPGVIANFAALIDVNSPPPLTADIAFSRGSTHIKVKKDFTLVAADTPEFDLANVGIVEQNLELVPEPASIGLLVLGTLALLRRR